MLESILHELKQVRSQKREGRRGGERGRTQPLPDPNKLILSTTENMPFSMIYFKL